MALAVSASLRDEQERRRRLAESQLLELGLEDELEARRAAGAPPPVPEPQPPPTDAEPAAGRSRRAGRKKAGPPPLLTVQTKEERDRRLSEKVAQLLAWEEEVPVDRWQLRSRKGKTEPSSLWNKTAQIDQDRADFYVPELVGLVEPCTAPINSLLKDVALIPGRQSLSQKVPGSESSGTDEDPDEEEDPASSTQAALLQLAGASCSPSQADAETPRAAASQGAADAPPSETEVRHEAGPQAPSGSPGAHEPEGGGELAGGSAGESSCMRLSREAAGVESPQERTRMSHEWEAQVGAVEMSPEMSNGNVVKASMTLPSKQDIQNTNELEKSLKLREDLSQGFQSQSDALGCEDVIMGRPSSSAPREAGCSPPENTDAWENVAERGTTLETPHLDAVEDVEVPEDVESCHPPSDGDDSAADWAGLSAAGGDHSTRTDAVRHSQSSAVSCSPGSPASSRPVVLDSCEWTPASPPPVRCVASSPDSTAASASPAGLPCFRAAGGGQLGAQLLQLLESDAGPRPLTLVCADGEVAVHAAVLAVRCPPLYRAAAAADGGRLLLPGVGRRAAASLVRLLYLSELSCAAGDGPLAQLLLLAERYDQPKLARHLRNDHGVSRPASAAGSLLPTPPPPPPLSPELFDLPGSEGGREPPTGLPDGSQAGDDGDVPALGGGDLSVLPAAGRAAAAAAGTPPRPGRRRRLSAAPRCSESEDACEVLTPPAKRPRTAPGSGGDAGAGGDRRGSLASQEEAASEAAAASPSGLSEPGCDRDEPLPPVAGQEPAVRPASADSDVQILEGPPEHLSQRWASSPADGDRDRTSPKGRSPARSPTTQMGISPVKSPAARKSPSRVDSWSARGSPCAAESLAVRSPSPMESQGPRGRVSPVESPTAQRSPSPLNSLASQRNLSPVRSSLAERTSSPAELVPAEDIAPGTEHQPAGQKVSPVEPLPSGGMASSAGSPSAGTGQDSSAACSSLDASVADVWEGFEDCGYIELVEAPDPGPPGHRPTPGPAAARSWPSSEPGGRAPGATGTLPAGRSPARAAGGAPPPVEDRSELWQDDSLLADVRTPIETGRRPPPERPGSETPVGRGRQQTPQQTTQDTAEQTTQQTTQQTPQHATQQTLQQTPQQTAQQTPQQTPQQQQTPVNPYRVVLRESSTPLPNYVLMLTPELKRELARIGVKPIARRKAVALLSHIYEETHPPAPAGWPGPGGACAMSRDTGSSASRSRDSGVSKPRSRDPGDSMSWDSDGSKSRPRDSGDSEFRFRNPGHSVPRDSGDSKSRSRDRGGSESRSRDPGGCKSRSRDRGGSESLSRDPGDSESRDSDGSGPRSRDRGGIESRSRSRDAAGAPTGDRHRSDSESSAGSDGSAARLEEALSQLSDDDDVTPSQAVTGSDLPALMTSFIRSRPDLHRQVLTYEPVWLESLHQDLKQAGVKVKLSQLMDFLDEQCVTFRTENSGRRRRSPKKKKSPKKSSPKKRTTAHKKKLPEKATT